MGLGREMMWAKTDISHDWHSARHLSMYDTRVHSQWAVIPAMLGAATDEEH